ncbi:MAG: hypothetical protein HZC41_18225 [Chloroflexi bacterium]|nr:hypothetical protein [Chloroflexota bacterium]
MTTHLIPLLMETGLVQFGRFQTGAGTRPFLLSLDYLPAYPDVLKQVTQAAVRELDGLAIHRLVATADAVPLGVALSLATDLSLVYSRGQREEAVYDLVGAYNIGHAAVLVCTVLADIGPLLPFIAAARRVGLEIHTLLAVLDLDIQDAIPDVTVKSLLTLPTVITALSSQGVLPAGQAQAVLEWIQAQRLNPRPGAASP